MRSWVAWSTSRRALFAGKSLLLLVLYLPGLDPWKRASGVRLYHNRTTVTLRCIDRHNRPCRSLSPRPRARQPARSSTSYTHIRTDRPLVTFASTSNNLCQRAHRQRAHRQRAHIRTLCSIYSLESCLHSGGGKGGLRGAWHPPSFP